MAGNQYLTKGSSVPFQLNTAAQLSSDSVATSGALVALNSSSKVDSSLLPSISASFNYNSKTASFTAAVADFDNVDLNGASGSVTATLPDATTCAGELILIGVKTAHSGRSVSFATTSSQNINGTSAGSLASLSVVDQNYLFISDGSGWWTIGALINLASSSNVTGVLGAVNGGLGYNASSAANGHMPIGNGSGYVDGVITSSGNTITVTTGSGTLNVDVDQANLSLGSIGGSVALGSQVSGTLPVSNSWKIMTVTVSETIAVGALINLYNNSSTLNVRNADNTSTSKQAHGAALTGASTGTITVMVGNGPVTGLSGLTIGQNYFLGTAGGVTSTAPTSSGDIVQPVGVAVSSTELQLILGTPYSM